MLRPINFLIITRTAIQRISARTHTHTLHLYHEIRW